MSNGLPAAYQPCTVDGAGAYAGDIIDGPPGPDYDPGGPYVILTDWGGAFQKQFFYFDRANNAWPREMLSVALTAISTQRQVGAIVDPPPYEFLDQFPNCRALSILPVVKPIGATWKGHLKTWNTRGFPEEGDFSMPVVFTREDGQWKMNVFTFSVDIGERYALQPLHVGSGTVNGDHATLKLPLSGSGYIDLVLTLDLSTDETVRPPGVPPQSGVPHGGNQLDMVGQGQWGSDTFWAAFRGTIDAWP